MNMRRILKHLLSFPWALQRAFPPATLSAIEEAVRASEKQHGGELRFVVEQALDGTPLWKGLPPRERALDIFSRLRIWDTRDNNGVLIYLLLADRDVEIVADRGLNGKVAPGEWEEICHVMEAAFREGRYQEGALEGVRRASTLLAKHFPPRPNDKNEIDDKPLLM